MRPSARRATPKSPPPMFLDKSQPRFQPFERLADSVLIAAAGRSASNLDSIDRRIRSECESAARRPKRELFCSIRQAGRIHASASPP